MLEMACPCLVLAQYRCNVEDLKGFGSDKPAWSHDHVAPARHRPQPSAWSDQRIGDAGLWSSDGRAPSLST